MVVRISRLRHFIVVYFNSTQQGRQPAQIFNKVEFSLVYSAKATFYIRIIAWLQIFLYVGISNEKIAPTNIYAIRNVQLKQLQLLLKGLWQWSKWGLLALVFHRCCSDDGSGSWNQRQNRLQNIYSSHGNSSHKEGDVSFSVSESFGLWSVLHSEKPVTFPR